MRAWASLLGLLVCLPLAAGCGAPSHRDAAAESSFALAREHGRYFEVNGIDTFAITLGSGSDIVLLHGNPSSSYSWRHLIPKLAARYRVHAIDLPGYGFSEKPADAPYTTSWVAGHVAAYMDAVGIESAVVVGNSMGGEIASEIAAIYPRRVRALVLIAPAGLPSEEIQGRPLAYELARIPGLSAVAPLLPLRSMIASTLREAYFDGTLVTDTDIDAYALPLRTEGGLRAFVARATRDDAFDRSMLVRGIKVPTLVVLGEVDRVTHLSVGRAYHTLIANSRLVTIARSGHLPQEETPEPVLTELEAWLPTLP